MAKLKAIMKKVRKFLAEKGKNFCKENLAFIAAMLYLWPLRLFITLLTLGCVGALYAIIVVEFWDIVFETLKMDFLRNFFSSYCLMDKYLDDRTIFRILAINYLRIGLIETLLIFCFCKVRSISK